MKNHVAFDCAICHKAVAGEIVSVYYIPVPDDEIDLNITPGVILTSCPICKNPSLLKGEHLDYETYQEWISLERVWPESSRIFNTEALPSALRKDIQDAIRSYNANIYSACVVLCGRALERIVKEMTGEYTIHKGLAKMRDEKIIDPRLFEWANELREQRNIGAHASEVEVTKENARDVQDFLIAICDYIYVLSKKFNEFKLRKVEKRVDIETRDE